MTKEYEIYKCGVLIKMLMKRNKPIEEALQVYPKSIFNKAKEVIKNANARN
jgi:hypothetical protein